MIFMIEYGLIGFYRVLLSYILWGGNDLVVISVRAVVVIVFLGVLRLRLPRSRYDLNMM